MLLIQPRLYDTEQERRAFFALFLVYFSGSSFDFMKDRFYRAHRSRGCYRLYAFQIVAWKWQKLIDSIFNFDILHLLQVREPFLSFP